MLNKDTILKQSLAFMESKLILTSVELGLYELLYQKKLSAENIAAELEINIDKILDFLDPLLCLGYIDREGLGLSAIYSNSKSSSKYLVKNSEDYIGGMLIMSSKRLYKYWHDLPEALKTGKAQSEVKTDNRHLFEVLYDDEEKLYDFCKAMQSLSTDNFKQLVEVYDFANTATHLDFGGSLGALSNQIAKKYKHVKCSSLDLENVTKLAIRENPKSTVEFIAGDMFTSDLAQVDSISLGLILHDWNLQDKKRILKRCFDALKPNGKLLVIENVIDDERKENLFGMLMSLNMLIEFGDAFDFSQKDFEPWAREAGFSKVEKRHIQGSCFVLIAHKG